MAPATATVGTAANPSRTLHESGEGFRVLPPKLDQTMLNMKCDPDTWAEEQIAKAYDSLDEPYGWAFLDAINEMLEAGINKVLIGVALYIQSIASHALGNG